MSARAQSGIEATRPVTLLGVPIGSAGAGEGEERALRAAGIGWGELEELVVPLAASPRLAGISVTCFNPD